MGGASSYGGIYIQLQNQSCFGGQEVTGVIHVNLTTDLGPSTLFLALIGQEHTEWQETRRVRETHFGSRQSRIKTVIHHHQGNHQICNIQCPIYSFQYGVNRGNYSLPFSFILPQNIPGSFLYAVGTTKASIAYRLQADFVSAKNERISGGVDIHIRQAALGVNTDLSVSKQARMKTWCFIDKGICEIRVSYPQDTYHPSQIAEFKVIVDNSQSKLGVNSLTCSFDYSIRLKDSGGRTKFIKDTLLRSQVNVNIGPQAELAHGSPVEFKLNLPSMLNIFENMYSTRGNLIDCMYTNKIEAIMDSIFMCCGDKPSVSSIMTIVPNVVIAPSAPQAPVGWQPQVLERVFVSYDSSQAH